MVMRVNLDMDPWACAKSSSNSVTHECPRGKTTQPGSSCVPDTVIFHVYVSSCAFGDNLFCIRDLGKDQSPSLSSGPRKKARADRSEDSMQAHPEMTKVNPSCSDSILCLLTQFSASCVHLQPWLSSHVFEISMDLLWCKWFNQNK